ncbi:MAG: glycosyltransferase 87 family protein [Actinomycetes bacterium]
MVVAVLLRQHCRTTLWASPDQFTHACYSDVPVLFVSRGFASGVLPYLERWQGGYLEQPVGTGALLELLTVLAPDTPHQARTVFDLAALLLLVALLALLTAVKALSGRRPWDAALVAFSPVLLTASLVSLDLVAVSLAVLGVLAFARHRPVLAGALLGLAVAVRPLGVLVVVALLLLGVRSGRWRPVLKTAGAAVLAWVVVNLPVAVAAPEGWRASLPDLGQQSVGYGSIWLLPQLAGRPLPPAASRVLFLLGLVVVLAATLLFVLASRVRPRVPVVVLCLVGGVLAVSLSVPVQASLWVLPFAALAVPRWRDLLLWGGTEAVYDTVTWFYIYGQSDANRAAPPWVYGVVLVARLLALAWLVAMAVRGARDPALDPVRVAGGGQSPGSGRESAAADPCAGELAHAPDVFVVRLG